VATEKRTTTSAGRFYHIEDRDLPSVTTILGVINKPALAHWIEKTTRAAVIDTAADLHVDLAKANAAGVSRAAYIATIEARLGKAKATDREMVKAQEIGTQAHALIEWTLRKQLGQIVGDRPATTPPAEWAFMSFEDWAKSVSLEPVYVEQTVWSLDWGFAGTLDLLARVNGELMLIDFKTGKAIYDESYLQNVAYQVALDEMGHPKPSGGLIVRLPKLETDPAFEVGISPSVEELFPVFVAAIQLWQWWQTKEDANRKKFAAKRAGRARASA